MDIENVVMNEIARHGGLLRLRPAWVSRIFLPPGKRLGLPEAAYDAGERGYIVERWLGSTTPAENPVLTPDEGLSFLAIDTPVTLKDAVAACPEAIMGAAYARTHKGLGRLPKIFDNGDRLPFHIHQMQRDADKLGKKSKEESYYFPAGIPMGPHPETFFGLHPYIVRENRRDLILSCLEDWERSDRLLALSRAYLNIPDDGFHLPAGILHAPGSALTIELQEDSDVSAMFQGRLAHRMLDRSALTRDVPSGELAAKGYEALIDQLDWEANGDPFFYENHHTPPVPVEESEGAGGSAWWIFYNTDKYSGKKVIVKPGGVYELREPGAYNTLIWEGCGTFGGLRVEGKNHAFDEILVTAERAENGVVVKNDGAGELTLFSFFGPEVHDDAPRLRRWG